MSKLFRCGTPGLRSFCAELAGPSAVQAGRAHLTQPPLPRQQHGLGAVPHGDLHVFPGAVSSIAHSSPLRNRPRLSPSHKWRNGLWKPELFSSTVVHPVSVGALPWDHLWLLVPPW